MSDRTRVLCNVCGNPTWHEELSEHKTSMPLFDDATGEEVADVSYRWQVYRCLGCSSLSLREEEDTPWDPETNVSYYPSRRKHEHARKYYLRLPRTLGALYGEVVDAFNHGSLILCAAGLRALLEGLCQDKGILEGPNRNGVTTTSLEGKINALSSVVPEGIVQNLHGFRFLGNRALHELAPPSKEDLSLALAVVEDIFNVVYDLNYRAEQLRAKAERGSKTEQALGQPSDPSSNGAT